MCENASGKGGTKLVNGLLLRKIPIIDGDEPHVPFKVSERNGWQNSNSFELVRILHAACPFSWEEVRRIVEV